MKLLGVFLSGLVMALTLALFVGWSGASTLSEGSRVGFLVAIGFVAAALGVNDLFEGRSKRLWFINSGYNLVTLVIMGVILTLWR